MRTEKTAKGSTDDGVLAYLDQRQMGSFKGLSDTLNSEPLKCQTFALLDN